MKKSCLSADGRVHTGFRAKTEYLFLNRNDIEKVGISELNDTIFSNKNDNYIKIGIIFKKHYNSKVLPGCYDDRVIFLLSLSSVLTRKRKIRTKRNRKTSKIKT